MNNELFCFKIFTIWRKITQPSSD